MTSRTVLSCLVITCGLLLTPHLAHSQSATDFNHPLVNGERTLTFQVNTGGINRRDLNVTVFYSDRRDRLNNLGDTSLSRGRPVMRLDGPTLMADFVLPHQDFPRDPNKALYVSLRNRGVPIVRYDDVEAEIAAQGSISGIASFLEDFMPDNVANPTATLDINPVVHPRNTCVFYRVRIRRNNEVLFTSAIGNFRMPDTYNIAIAGDSYGAGEGAPADEFEVLGNNEDMWSHNDCHRSRKSGLVRAVKRFIQRNPGVAVDYIHVACTGARVANLISDEQTRAVLDFGSPVRVQFESIQRFLDNNNQPHNELNLLLLSIGGNNAGFGSYVADFIVFAANAADDEELPDEIEENLEELAERYEDLDEAVRERFPTAKVAISNYPDSTRGPRGRCGNAPGPIEFAATYHCCLAEVDPIFNPVEEYRFTFFDFINPLNEVIEDAVDQFNEENSSPDWYLIDVEDRIGEHGFCACDEPFINRMAMSLGTQGDIFGLAHPTRDGYKEIYRTRGANKVQNIYDDFVIERRFGLALAAILEIDTPLLPEPCIRLVAINPLFELLAQLEYTPTKNRLLQNFILDSEVRAASRARDLTRLKRSSAYKTLLAQKAEARKIVDDAFPKALKRTSPPRKEKPSEREQRATKRVRDYIASKKFQDLRTQILRSRKTTEVDKDKLDRFFNR